MSNILSIDDTDGSIGYSGSWDPVSSSTAYQSTLHSTTQTGATATFSFNGNMARVFGHVPACDSPSNIVVQFSMDGVASNALSMACTSSPRQDVIYFATPTLSNGSHKLTITNMGTGPFQLDHIEIGSDGSAPPTPVGTASTTSNGASSPTSSALPSGSTSLPSTGPTTLSPLVPAPAMSSGGSSLTPVTGPSTSSSSSPDNATSSSSSSPHLGPIIGAVVGAFVVVIFLGFLFIHCRRRRRSSQPTSRAASQRTIDEEAVLQYKADYEAPSKASSSSDSVMSPDTSMVTQAEKMQELDRANILPDTVRLVTASRDSPTEAARDEDSNTRPMMTQVQPESSRPQLPALSPLLLSNSDSHSHPHSIPNSPTIPSSPRKSNVGSLSSPSKHSKSHRFSIPNPPPTPPPRASLPPIPKTASPILSSPRPSSSIIGWDPSAVTPGHAPRHSNTRRPGVANESLDWRPSVDTGSSS